VSVIWLETSSSTSGKFEACFFGPHSPHEIAAFGVEQKNIFRRIKTLTRCYLTSENLGFYLSKPNNFQIIFF
jgi:hypothetical protein